MHSEWDAIAAAPDAEIPLLRTALLIARDEYPDLDMQAYEAKFEAQARALTGRVNLAMPAVDRLAALNRYLFEELGYTGNQRDYYDPRNSYLNDVLDRRLGIPISLAVIQIELARRLDLPLQGVSFPGHFLVRLPVDGGLLVLDPYHRGRSIDADELRQRAQPHFGDRDIADHQLLQMLSPASHRAILIRMLRNLKGVYAEREVWDKALRCSDRLLRLDPAQAEEWRDRGLFYLRIGLGSAARANLSRYLSLAPEAGDAATVREALIEASSLGGRVH